MIKKNEQKGGCTNPFSNFEYLPFEDFKSFFRLLMRLKIKLHECIIPELFAFSKRTGLRGAVVLNVTFESLLNGNEEFLKYAFVGKSRILSTPYLRDEFSGLDNYDQS